MERFTSPPNPLSMRWRGDLLAGFLPLLRVWRGGQKVRSCRGPYSPVLGGGATAELDASISDCRSNKNGLLDGSKMSCTLSLRFSM
jgi:hypothetical protein